MEGGRVEIALLDVGDRIIEHGRGGPQARLEINDNWPGK